MVEEINILALQCPYPSRDVTISRLYITRLVQPQVDADFRKIWTKYVSAMILISVQPFSELYSWQIFGVRLQNSVPRPPWDALDRYCPPERTYPVDIFRNDFCSSYLAKREHSQAAINFTRYVHSKRPTNRSDYS